MKSTLNHKKILVIDDDETLIGLIKRILIPYECKVVEAPTSMEGIYNFNTDTFDMAMIDINLNGALDGIEVAKYFLERKPGMKIKMMSGLAEDFQDEVTRLELGPILKKPFKINDFLRLME